MAIRMLVLCILLLINVAVFAQAPLPPEVYTTPGPHVVVNGTLVRAPVRNVNGRLLLPMRAVFEALQSDVQWFAATQQVTATRGQTVVQLWIGRSYALVNSQQVPLDVPPQLINSVTYVPLRFPAEAFGGDVIWDPTTQTAIITIPPLGTVPPPTATFTGTLLDVRTTDGRTLIVQERGTNTIVAVPLASNTVMTRGRVNVPAQSVNITDLQPGDLVVITRDSAGRATRIDATYQQVTGRVSGITANRVLLQDGAVYELRPELRVTDTLGNPVSLSSVPSGTEVTLRITPGTSQVWAIMTTTTAPPPGTPSITSVSAVNYTRPLRAGETLVIQATGMPQADAVTARVGDLLTNIPLAEQSPGVYQGQVTIPANVNLTETPIYARMRRGTTTSAEVRSTQTITIDTLPPVIGNRTPANNSQIADRNPVISASFDDRGGSGINPQAVRIRVNGIDVTGSALINQTGISYQGRDLPTGQVVIQVEAADRAGNTTAADWRFTVTTGAPGSLQILSVTHNATSPLQPGQQVTFTTRLSAQPTRLEWYLDNQLIATGGTRATGTLEYTQRYTIRSTDPTGTHTLSVRVFDAAGNSLQQAASNPLIIGTPSSQTFGITAPADDTPAPDPLVVTGTAPAGSQVRVTVTYQGSIVIFPTQGQLFQGTVTTNSNRIWTTSGINLSVPALTTVEAYTVRAELLDAQGNVVQTDTVTLTEQ